MIRGLFFVWAVTAVWAGVAVAISYPLRSAGMPAGAATYAAALALSAGVLWAADCVRRWLGAGRPPAPQPLPGPTPEPTPQKSVTPRPLPRPVSAANGARR